MGIPGVKKKEQRWRADFLAAYHVDPDTLPYEVVVGLWENLSRVHYQAAIASLLGTAAAHGGVLPRIWFDALARYETEIDSLEWESNAPRLEAQVRRKKGR